MSEAFLMRRGGKNDVLDVGVALICAKFPTGSTCVCEKDGRRLSSDSASGVAAFSVPEAGTWTLTITDGAQVKSGSATVAQGDVEILTLAYDPDELVILSPDGGLASGYSGVGGVEGARVADGHRQGPRHAGRMGHDALCRPRLQQMYRLERCRPDGEHRLDGGDAHARRVRADRDALHRRLNRRQLDRVYVYRAGVTPGEEKLCTMNGNGCPILR